MTWDDVSKVLLILIIAGMCVESIVKKWRRK